MAVAKIGELVHPLLERGAARLPLARREVEVDPLALDGFRQGCDLHAELRPHLFRSAGRILDDRAEPGELLAERREPQLDVGRRRAVRRSCGNGLDLEPKLKRDILDPRADLVEATVERTDLRFVSASSSFRLRDDAGQRADPLVERLDGLDEAAQLLLELGIDRDPLFQRGEVGAELLDDLAAPECLLLG